MVTCARSSGPQFLGNFEQLNVKWKAGYNNRIPELELDARLLEFKSVSEYDAQNRKMLSVQSFVWEFKADFLLAELQNFSSASSKKLKIKKAERAQLFIERYELCIN